MIDTGEREGSARSTNQYEYSTLVRSGAVDADALAGVSKDDATMAMLHATGWAVKEAESLLDRHQGGGWEIIGLDQLLVGPRVLVTFLLRR